MKNSVYGKPTDGLVGPQCTVYFCGPFRGLYGRLFAIAKCSFGLYAKTLVHGNGRFHYLKPFTFDRCQFLAMLYLLPWRPRSRSALARRHLDLASHAHVLHTEQAAFGRLCPLRSFSNSSKMNIPKRRERGRPERFEYNYVSASRVTCHPRTKI